MDNNDIFGGFEALTDGLIGPGQAAEGGISLKGDKLPTGNDPIVEPPKGDEGETAEEKEARLAAEAAAQSGEEGGGGEGGEGLTEEELKALELEKNAKPPKANKKEGAGEGEETFTFGEAEPDMAEYIQEQIFERFGIDTEGDDFKKFESMEDVTNFIEEAIKVNSIPEFANPEVEAIDKYVRNGGTLNTFMSSVHDGVDINNADLESESIQKAIVVEDLKNQGLSDARIKRKIERMEDMNILAEEAEDAIESVKEYRGKQEEKLLRDQQKAKDNSEKANMEFIRSVENELEGMDNVRGLPLTKVEKKQLYNYMLKPTSAGVPQYHLDYRSNQKNMIESAYFTMKGDKLINKVEKKASSLAAKKLQTRLADKGRRGKDQSTPGSGTSDVWGMISKQLR